MVSALRHVPKPGYGLAPRSHTFSSTTSAAATTMHGVTVRMLLLLFLLLVLTHLYLVFFFFVECLSLLFFIPFRTPFCRQRTHVFRSGLACFISCIDPTLNSYIPLFPYRTSPMEVSVTKHTAQIWAAVNQRVSSGVDLPLFLLSY